MEQRPMDPRRSGFPAEGLARRQLVAAGRQARLDIPFARVVRSMTQVENLRFGSEASADAATGDRAIRDVADLSAHFWPLQGEHSSEGRPLGGAGPSTINAEVQNYRSDFTSGNHVFEPDGLRLQATLEAGHHDSYLRGQIDRRGKGFTSNGPGESVPTPIAAIGLKASDLGRIEVGDVVNNGSTGLAAVARIDRAGETITLDALSGGLRSDYRGNFHLTFTRYAFGRIRAPETVENGRTRSIVFEQPLPASVVVGSTVRGVRRGEKPVFNPGSAAHPTVSEISADRRTVDFDRPVHFHATLKTQGGDGVLFMPGVWSGQIWSKRSYGPQRPGVKVQALRVEVTMPAMSNYPGTVGYTREAVERNIAAYPDVAWGYWPALWLYQWRPGPDGAGQLVRPGEPNPWSEIDILELFVRMGGGPSVWTGYLHDQPYTRRVASDRSLTRALNGGRWLSSAPNKSLQTPDAGSLLMPEPIANGRKRAFGVVWTATQVIHYMDDVAVCLSEWPVETSYPHQLGLNVACGSLGGGNPAALLFPQRDRDATAQFMTVHSIRSWEI